MPAALKKEWPALPSSRCSRVTGRWIDVVAFGAIILIGMALLMAMNARAFAQDAEDTTERIAVAYAASDLSDPARLHALLARIDRAALHACGDNPWEAGAIRSAIAHSECRKDSVLRAAAQSRSPALRRAAADYVARLKL